MQIPSNFKIGRKKYAVAMVAKLPKRVKGRVYPMIGRIELSMQYSPTVAATFWHEVTHAILHDMDAYVKWDNEKFVDAFSKRLAQVIDSAELPNG
jgi:hypothetical protein